MSKLNAVNVALRKAQHKPWHESMTAIETLIDTLMTNNNGTPMLMPFTFTVAIDIEREQIIQAFNAGKLNQTTAEEYYDNKYKLADNE